ncbi:MAG: hypothetical protein NXH83_11085 [Rhodobacteraceae bacterium]|nr:hypothetical protein [Paracoccaceae bacterium]
MTVRIEPPVVVAGHVLRAVVTVRRDAAPMGARGIAAHGEKRPVAIIVGTGAAARLLGLDGAERAPEDFGLTPQDIA